MLYSISSLFGFYTWIVICICSLIPAIQPFLVRYIKVKRWIAGLCACITVFSGVCAIQKYINAKEIAYPMNLFNSYDDVQNHDNFKYKIIVYDEKDSKQVRVHDNENSLTFDFIVKNDNEATTEYVNSSLDHR